MSDMCNFVPKGSGFAICVACNISIELPKNKEIDLLRLRRNCQLPRKMPCVFLGKQIGEIIRCDTCKTTKKTTPLHECGKLRERLRQCTPKMASRDYPFILSCKHCPDYAAAAGET